MLLRFLFKRKILVFHQSRFKSTAITFEMLRPYQQECVETTLLEFKKGCQRQIVSLPVGSGKTVIMSNLIPLIPSPTPKATKVLLLAHRTELLDQAHNQITKYNPNLNVQIEQGKRKVDIDKADVIVASVPTIGRASSSRIEAYDPSIFKAILIDEAHHAVADTYGRILDYFGIFKSDNQKLLWGCSATVKRHDGQALNTVFDKITYHVGFLQMIEQRYLSSMRVTTVKTNVKLDDVRYTKVDFVEKELASVINTDARNEVIVSSWQKYAHEQGRKSTLVFALNIEHTIKLCNKFIDAGINARFITSKSNPIERLEVLDAFRAGEIPVLVNCAILTEGTDIPCVDCILMARPTRSATLFQQMFGRGLRLHGEKEDCLVIDFVDNFKTTGQHGLVTVPTLLGLDTTEIVQDKTVLELEEKAESERMEKTEEEDYDPDCVQVKVTEYEDLKELMIDLSTTNEIKSASNYNWINIGKDKCVLNILNTGFMVLEKLNGKWIGTFRRENIKSDFFPKPTRIPLEASDLPSAIRGSETWLQKSMTINRGSMLRTASFRKDKMTEAQEKALSRYKIEVSSKMTKGQAMDLLTKLRYGQLNIWKLEWKLNEKKKLLEKKKMDAAALLRENKPKFSVVR